MKFIDRMILCIFSVLILIFAILFSCVIFGWLDLTTIYMLVSNALLNQVTCNILIGVNILLILMALKGVFFESSTTEKEYSNDGILLQNEDGKLLITRDTITSIVNSVVSGFDSVKDADTRISLSDNNDLLITLNIEVDENDELITIKTCTRYFGAFEKQLFVIDARKVRNDEKIEKYKVKKDENFDMLSKGVASENG